MSETPILDVKTILKKMASIIVDISGLKNLLSVPPIMAVRTIKQLAVKGIIKFDEDTNVITMP